MPGRGGSPPAVGRNSIVRMQQNVCVAMPPHLRRGVAAVFSRPVAADHMLHVSPELERAPEPPQLSPRRTGVLAWVGPFAVFMAWLAADKLLPIPNPTRQILRHVVLVASIFGFSRRLLPTRAPYWLGSTAVGPAVFAP